MFTAEALSPDQFRSVYPLIRQVVPALTLNQWLRFARMEASPRRGGGIIAVRRTARDFPCGLFCYRVENDLEHGRVLVAEHIVALDLLDPDAVLKALVAEIESLGTRLGCTAVRSVLHHRADHVAGGLSAAGHTLEGEMLVKSLIGAGTPLRFPLRREVAHTAHG